MATRTELEEQRAALIIELAAVNAQILAIVQQKNKKYLYSNQETTHQAETQSLKELSDLRKEINQQIAAIDSQLGCGYFVQLKN